MPPRPNYYEDEPPRRPRSGAYHPSERARSRSREAPSHRHRAPTSSTSDDSPSRRVHFPEDPADPRYQARGRASNRQRSHSSRSRSRSVTRSPSREVVYYVPAQPPVDEKDKEDKPWFKKKTVWTTVASLATVAALVPTTMAANASVDAAHAASKSARNTKRAAHAGETSAKASMLSARAVNNTTIAQGHQDRYGRYTGPARNAHGSARSIGYADGSRRATIW